MNEVWKKPPISLQAYQDTLGSANTTIILSPKSDFLKYLSDGPGTAARKK